MNREEQYGVTRRHFLLAGLALSVLGGCGFSLRRLDGMPFTTLYIDAPASSVAAQRLRKLLGTDGSVTLVDQAVAAQAVLTLAAEDRRRVILSLSGAGRVTEYRLEYRLQFSLAGKDGMPSFVPEQIELTRDFTYDDAQLLAKGAEEQLLYRDMEDDAVQRIVRRLRSLSR